MSEVAENKDVDVKNTEKQTAENNNQKQYDDGKATFNFGQLVGNFGKYADYQEVGDDKTPMLRFSLRTMNQNGYSVFVPLVAWNKTAEILHQNAQPGQMIGVGYGLRANAMTNANNHKQYFDEATAFTLYSQLNGYYNVGKLIGNFDRFSTYKMVGKNKNTAMLRFRLNIRDYKGNFHNVPMIAWGQNATDLHNKINASDFIEVAYSLNRNKFALPQNRSMNVPQPTITNFRLLKSAQAGAPANPSNQADTPKQTSSSADNSASNKASLNSSSASLSSSSASSVASSSASVNSSASADVSSSSSIDISDDDLPF